MSEDASESLCTGEDEELSILAHASEYMNEADDRAMERLMFYLTHRYFPEGSFQPVRVTMVHVKEADAS